MFFGLQSCNPQDQQKLMQMNDDERRDEIMNRLGAKWTHDMDAHSFSAPIFVHCITPNFA